MNKEKEFQAFDWGMEKIDLTGHGEMMEMRPNSIHHKLNGTVDEKPSFVMVMENPDMPYKVFGQISVGMLNYALLEIGYKIVKT